MSGPAELIETADRNQARASEPDASVWVSANAGTGKTAVLVKRILRLLVAGAAPESILCLTYTKTAAAEMQNRLLKTLSAWALMPEDRLRETLGKLLRAPFDAEDMQGARRLFARVLEAQGGLKIHTIHGFCERLLQRFPLEAVVSPNFTVLDEAKSSRMRNAAFDGVAVTAIGAPESPLGQALIKIVSLTDEEQFRKIVREVLAKRAELLSLARRYFAQSGSAPWPQAEAEALKKFLGVAGKDEAALIAEQAALLADDDIDDALAVLTEFGRTKTDRAKAEILSRARHLSGQERAALLSTLFLTQKGEPRVRLFTRAVSDNSPDIIAMLDSVKAAFARIETAKAHLRVVTATAAVLTFAEEVQTAFDAAKRREAALDYDDLIVKTLDLL
ncbi:MAG: UvrD-helicase domain-containing protein, partial [Pseudomonadota bacterium]